MRSTKNSEWSFTWQKYKTLTFMYDVGFEATYLWFREEVSSEEEQIWAHSMERIEEGLQKFVEVGNRDHNA